MGAADFDAKSRKIRHVTLPIDDDDDIANKRYVLQSVKILKDRQVKIEKKIAMLQNSIQIMINELQNIQQVTTINKEYVSHTMMSEKKVLRSVGWRIKCTLRREEIFHEDAS